MAAVLSVLPAFLLAALAVTTLPGPATALVLREAAVTGSRRRVAGVIGGIEAGLFAWVVLAALGVAALVAASELAYVVLKAVGAAVLVLLGLQMLWYARKRRTAAQANDSEPGDGATRTQRVPGLPRMSGFPGGLLTNLANPKAAVFAFSFYPQFIPPHAPVLPVSMLLGLIHVGIDVCWFSLLALAVSRLRPVLASPRLRRWLERVVGAVMLGVGLRLAVEHGP